MYDLNGQYVQTHNLCLTSHGLFSGDQMLFVLWTEAEQLLVVTKIIMPACVCVCVCVCVCYIQRTKTLIQLTK